MNRPAFELRAFLRLGALSLSMFLVAIAALAFYDSQSSSLTEFAPVEGTSALDGWKAPWPPDDSESASLDSAHLPAKWWVIGWDGADWDFVLPLLEQGRLPNLEALMRGGSYGTLQSIIPTVSPAIWTTIATGVSPGKHRILHFYNKKPRLKRWLERAMNFGKLERTLFSNADRRAPAVWNELSELGREVMLVGYHNTFPVEKVNGLMVSNYLVQDSVANLMEMDVGGSGAGLGGSLVYPPESLQEILELQKDVLRRTPEAVDRFAVLDEAEKMPFLRLSQRLDVEDQKPYYLVHAWLFDTVVAEVADAFLARSSPDLAMIHFQAADWAAHRFYYFHDSSPFDEMGWSAKTRAKLTAEMPRYHDTLDEFYVYLDEWLGRLLRHRTPDTGVMLLSDHGFEPDSDPFISGGHDHAPPGMLVLEGPGIRSGHRLGAASVYDILPTLMAGLQLPVADDLVGSPIADAFSTAAWQNARHSTVPTYGAGHYVPQISRPARVDREVLEQLESLGYLD